MVKRFSVCAGHLPYPPGYVAASVDEEIPLTQKAV